VRALEAALVSSRSALDSNKLGYEVGVRINIDVLNAQQQVFSTLRDLSRARYDTILNGLRLKSLPDSRRSRRRRGEPLAGGELTSRSHPSSRSQIASVRSVAPRCAAQKATPAFPCARATPHPEVLILPAVLLLRHR